MSLEQQKQDLIALVDEYRERECQAVLDKAREKQREMISNAYRDARRLVHKVAKRERSRASIQVRGVEAELHTKVRALQQRVARSLLQEGWMLLKASLLSNWHNGETRLSWIKKCADEACARLNSGQWRVVHPVDTPAEELDQFVSWVHEELPDAQLTLQVGDDVKAGLIIHSQGIMLDMSIDGLLKDRTAIEGRMLALMRKVGQE
jgi:vacuolar-type H+-ATPase subunit H